MNASKEYIENDNTIIANEHWDNINYLNCVDGNVGVSLVQHQLSLKDANKILDDLIDTVVLTNIGNEKKEKTNKMEHDVQEIQIVSDITYTNGKSSMFYPKKSSSWSEILAKKFKRKSVESDDVTEPKISSSIHLLNKAKKNCETIAYDDIEPLKRRKSNNISYTSNDNEENKDIESKEWSKIKLMNSDQEYINHAQRKLGNREVSDPCQCMSYHGYRRSIKALDNPDLMRLRAKNFTNSRRIDSRSKLVLKIRGGKMEIAKYEIQQQKSKKRKNLDYEGYPNPKRIKLVPFEHYEMAMCQVLATYKKLDLPSDWLYFLRHFKISMIETKGFLKHYLETQVDKSGRFLMPLGFFEKAVCMEMIFRTFITYYGSNEKIRCKDCEFMDQSKKIIMHTT